MLYTRLWYSLNWYDEWESIILQWYGLWYQCYALRFKCYKRYTWTWSRDKFHANMFQHLTCILKEPLQLTTVMLIR